jgi:hypothetical protein
MRSSLRIDVLLIGSAAVAVAAFFYSKHLDLEISRERRIAQAEVYDRQRQCAVDGTKWAEGYRREEESAATNSGLAAWDDPAFHYNVERAACLVRTRFVDSRSYVTLQHARITDLSSNRAVLESRVKLSPDPGKTDGSLREELTGWGDIPDNLSRAEFVKRAQVLMSK